MTRKAVFRESSTGAFDDGSGIATFPAAVASVFGRTGAVVAVTGDYYGAVAAALTGATQASRYVGATTSGAPASGTFAVGDFVIARDGHVFVCTVAGTPGTWVDAASASGVSSLAKNGSTGLTGAVTLTGGTGVTLTQAGNDISIASSGGGGIPQASKVLRTAGNFTTTSATFVDVTGITVTITTGAHRVLIVFSATVTSTANGGVCALDIDIDGTRQGGTLGLIDMNPPASSYDMNGSFSYLTDVLSAGAHTFKLQTRSSGGATVTINASGTYPAQFSVIELPV